MSMFSPFIIDLIWPHSFHEGAEEQSLLNKQIAEEKLVTECSNYNPAKR